MATNLIYQRHVEVREGVSADIALTAEPDQGTVILSFNGNEEASFVLDLHRESSRLLAGMTSGKLFYALEAAAGYTS